MNAFVRNTKHDAIKPPAKLISVAYQDRQHRNRASVDSFYGEADRFPSLPRAEGKRNGSLNKSRIWRGRNYIARRSQPFFIGRKPPAVRANFPDANLGEVRGGFLYGPRLWKDSIPNSRSNGPFPQSAYEAMTSNMGRAVIL